MKKVSIPLLLTCLISLSGLALAEDVLKTVKVGGYVDTEWKSTDTANTFTAHRLVLYTSAKPHKNIHFNSEIEYEYGGAVNANGDKGEIKIEQAWVDYTMSDLAILRTGIVLVPFGHVNLYHDSNIRETTIRPIHTRYIVPTTWFDTGVGLHGAKDLNDMTFKYEAYVLNGVTGTPSTGKGLRDVRPNFKADNNKDKAFSTRLSLSPRVGSEYGLSYYHDTAPSSISNTDISVIGFDVFQKWSNVEIVGEWAIIPENKSHFSQKDGYYLEARVKWFPGILKTVLNAKEFENPALTWFARTGEVNLNRGEAESKKQAQQTIGVNFRPIQSLAFKLEYEFNDGNLTEGNDNAIHASVALGF